MKLTPIKANMTEIEIGNNRVLFSYRTPVAAYDPDLGWIRTNKHYSQTTTRHINQWMGKIGRLVDQSVLDELVSSTA